MNALFPMEAKLNSQTQWQISEQMIEGDDGTLDSRLRAPP